MNLLTQFSKTATAPFVFLLGLLCFEFLTALEVVTYAPDAICLWPSVVMAAMEGMVPLPGWHQPDSRDRATSTLAREGIVCQRHGTGSVPPFGLIAFDKETPDLLEFVQRSSRDGIDRIMAVALNKTALTGATPGSCCRQALLTCWLGIPQRALLPLLQHGSSVGRPWRT